MQNWQHASYAGIHLRSSDFSSLTSNPDAFVCHHLLSTKHFANMQISCLLLSQLYQLQQDIPIGTKGR